MPLFLRHLPSPAGRTSRCSLDGQRAMMELRRAIHQSRTPEPYRASVWDESGVFGVDKGLWKNGNHFSTAFFLWLILMVSLQPCAPLRWQGNLIRRESKTTENQVTRFPPGRRGPQSGAGCCTARASNDTPPRQAAVWRSGQPLRFISTRSLVHPFAAARHFSTGKHVTGFAARFAPL